MTKSEVNTEFNKLISTDDWEAQIDLAEREGKLFSPELVRILLKERMFWSRKFFELRNEYRELNRDLYSDGENE